MISGIANDAKTTAERAKEHQEGDTDGRRRGKNALREASDDLSPDHQQPKINGSLDSERIR